MGKIKTHVVEKWIDSVAWGPNVLEFKEEKKWKKKLSSWYQKNAEAVKNNLVWKAYGQIYYLVMGKEEEEKKGTKTCQFSLFLKWSNICRCWRYIFISHHKGPNNIFGSPLSWYCRSSWYFMFSVHCVKDFKAWFSALLNCTAEKVYWIWEL